MWLDASHTLKTALTLIVSEVLECKTDIEEYTQANLTDLKQWMLELPLLLKN